MNMTPQEHSLVDSARNEEFKNLTDLELELKIKQWLAVPSSTITGMSGKEGYIRTLEGIQLYLEYFMRKGNIEEVLFFATDYHMAVAENKEFENKEGTIYA